MTKKPFSYQEAVQEIEEIIVKLENEEIELDLLSENVKKASELILKCKGSLKTCEAEIEKIIKTIQTDKS
jgi:exodeoxyribonuclease VII small subunit